LEGAILRVPTCENYESREKRDEIIRNDEKTICKKPKAASVAAINGNIRIIEFTQWFEPILEANKQQ